MIQETKRGTFRTRQKTEYNRENYEQCKIWIRKGGREIVQRLAAAAGMSMAEYVRHLVIIDAARQGFDVREALGGGGVATVTRCVPEVAIDRHLADIMAHWVV